MERAWRDYVREGLRKQEVFDLFDYNDFHWNRSARFADLRRAILAGRYKPNNSIPVKLEKGLGVCRTIIIPNPEDAVVLQCIVENLFPHAMRRQPSRNTFFSRSHEKTTGDFRFDSEYIWFKQWRKFSKRRFELTSIHHWVVTTDIATFFDNVRYEYLRNIISTFNNQKEVILDILFAVLDELCWKPDYLPSSQIGLPQVQFDAPRLLAHIYLFEIDEFLKKFTDDSFVRWVDDMTIAVKSREQGKCLLRDLDTLLQIRGLRLNSGKTKVLSAAQAAIHFQKLENETFEKIEARYKTAIKIKKPIKAIEKAASREFRKFSKGPSVGHSDKVFKRYIGLASDMRSDFAVEYLIVNFANAPELRDTFYRYMHNLGPRQDLFDCMRDYLTGANALDDASVCHVAQVLADWEVRTSDPLFKELRKLAQELCKNLFVQGNPHRFSAALALAVKYRTEGSLKAFIRATSAFWSRSEYLSRQVCAATGRMRSATFLTECVELIRGHAYKSAISVADAMTRLRSFTTSVPREVRGYILNGNNATTYKVHRLLVALVVLRSSTLHPNVKKPLKKAILAKLRDPYFRTLIKNA